MAPTPTEATGPGAREDASGIDPVLIDPIRHTSWRYYALLAALGAVVALGAYAYLVQINDGLEVTAMRDTVNWGLYISNFVFFIGISHAGTLISAILRLTGADWRRPITRIAESITVMALLVGATMPLIDLGRPDRLHHVFVYGRIESAILWDFLSISTYLVGSMMFLFLFLIPDVAILRDRLKGLGKFRRWVYEKLSLGWRGTSRQKRSLHEGIRLITILIIPIAVSVHTVVGWIFSMTLRPGWNSTIFGPYFVVGALISGVASLIMAMAVFRYFYKLEKYITYVHFRNLAYILLTLDIAYLYFTLSEYFTLAYKPVGSEQFLLQSLTTGEFAPTFWSIQVLGLILPAVIIAFPKTRSVLGIVVAATLVNVGMWLKRYIIVVATMVTPQMPQEWGAYVPTWVEWSITAGAFAAFMLFYAIFSKLFPIVSIWELQEEEAPEPERAEVPTGEVAV